MKQVWIGLVCLFPILFSCDKEEVIQEYVSPVGEANLPEEIPLGQSLRILVKHTGYNGCAKYSRTETNQNGNNLEITFYAKTVPPNGYCTQALIQLETPYLFTPKAVGTYIFKFRQVDSYLTDTLTVK